MASIGLVGNPNCGKTTVFNALTGARQRVGNWPGVTVSRKCGSFTKNGQEVTVVDLPGTYSLNMMADTSIDVEIANDYILSKEADIIVNIIDASNLERNLFLTMQLLEMGIPLLLGLNMMDVAEQRKLSIDVKALSKRLGCAVVPIVATKRKGGIDDLKQAILKTVKRPSCNTKATQYPGVIKTAIKHISGKIRHLEPKLEDNAHCLAIRLLEGDGYALQQLQGKLEAIGLEEQRQLIEQELDEEVDILIADKRFGYVHSIVKDVVIQQNQSTNNITSMLDRVVLNRFLGIPIFLAVMYCMFFFAINIGGAFQDFFDIGSNTIFVNGFAHLLGTWGTPDWIIAILASGVGKGINTTVTFIPVIGGMFLFLSFLEDSGYMARAAFVMDRFMRALGLPGKSFVPMIVGFGCNVPAIMAARTLDNKRDRVLTVMMSPFMSCGARLAIFAVFTAAFFPVGGQNIVFALYIIGILVAVLTGLVLRKTVLRGEPSPFVMELPPYHMPTGRALTLQTWQRLKHFIFKAGKVIIPVCLLIGVLNTLTLSGTLNLGDGSQSSLLSEIGRGLTPVFGPMGLHSDNWPATVGLLTGVLAKEVVIGTLNTLYTQVGHLAAASGVTFHFWAGIQEAFQSIPNNLSALGGAFSNPIMASAPDHTVANGVFGQMFSRFDGKVGAFAYLLFVLLYFPCISATAAMTRELSRRWTIFSVLWTTGLAYAVATLFYQAMTLDKHPASSIAWIGGIIIVLSLVIMMMRRYSLSDDDLPSAMPKQDSSC